MQVSIQLAKTTHFRHGGDGWFRACWGSRPNPRRTKMFWVTMPLASAARLKIVWKSGYNFAENFGEVESVAIIRQLILAA